MRRWKVSLVGVLGSWRTYFAECADLAEAASQAMDVCRGFEIVSIVECV